MSASVRTPDDPPGESPHDDNRQQRSPAADKSASLCWTDVGNDVETRHVGTPVAATEALGAAISARDGHGPGAQEPSRERRGDVERASAACPDRPRGQTTSSDGARMMARSWSPKKSPRRWAHAEQRRRGNSRHREDALLQGHPPEDHHGHRLSSIAAVGSRELLERLDVRSVRVFDGERWRT